MKVNKAFMQEINTWQKIILSSREKLSLVSQYQKKKKKIKDYNLEHEISKQYLISIIQNLTPGTNIFFNIYFHLILSCS